MHSRIMIQMHQLVTDSLPESVSVPLLNLANSSCCFAHRVSVAEQGIYQVKDQQDHVMISRLVRHARYRTGIRNWVNYLAGLYNLEKIQPAAGGVFIDCGANIGELGIWARSRGLAYHAFEPEPTEARCCDLNNFAGKPLTNRVGLWSETTELKFYSKAGTADSSLIEFAGYDRVFNLPVMALDDYIEQQSIKQIEVLKVEAEGAEPEVLQGARKALTRTRFVTVDCGPERGVEQTDTVRDVCNQLFAAGFLMIESDMQRLSLMFLNSNALSRAAA